MGKLTTLLGLVLAISALCAPQQLRATPQALSASQIKALFPGIYEGIADDKYEFIVSGGSNGQLIGRSRGREKTLPWKITGNKLCIIVTEESLSKTYCSRIVKDGIWYRAVKNDGTSQVKFKPYKNKNKND